MVNETDLPETLDLEIDGVLDLHTFRPGDVKDLLTDYLDACKAKGITQVRIIHGKGTGRMRWTVHRVLGRTKGIRSFRLAGEDAGGWGATLVDLDPSTPG
jgi:dsDNA-specific endonuclease/ATPase MutS2